MPTTYSTDPQYNSGWRTSPAAGVPPILEMLANIINLNTDLGLLAIRGRVIIIGSRGPVQIDPRQTMARDIDIRACHPGTPPT